MNEPAADADDGAHRAWSCAMTPRAADDASVRSSDLALGAAFEDASDDEMRANARERTVRRAETRGRSTRARRRVETREETSARRRAMDHRARAAGTRSTVRGRGDYSTSSSGQRRRRRQRPNARPPPRPKARFQRRSRRGNVRERLASDGGSRGADSKLRAMPARARVVPRRRYNAETPPR